MKGIFYVFLFFFFQVLEGKNDPFWWNPNLSYFKIEIEQNGWYKIDNEWIKDLPYPVLYHHGIKQKIYFVDSKESNFYGWYFFGRQSNMDFDQLLFLNNKKSLNQEKGLLSKYSPYFLTSDQEAFKNEYFVLLNGIEELPPMWESNCKIWEEFFFKPRLGPEQLISHAFFDHGEGFGSKPSANFKFEIYAQKTLIFRIANLGKSNQFQIKLDGQNVYSSGIVDPYELVIDSILQDPEKLYKIEISAEEEITLGSFCSGEKSVNPIILQPFSIMPVVFPKLPPNDANYLIIAPGSFKQYSSQLEDYVQFRKTNFNVALYFLDDLDNMFSYGYRKHPLSISKLIDFLSQNSKVPEFVFLVGKGIAYPYLKGEEINNLIPTFGFPGSDKLLIDPFQIRGEPIAIGRLSIQDPMQIKGYLSKVMAFENQINEFWKKRVLFSFGGKNKQEYEVNKNLLSRVVPQIESSSFSGEVIWIERNTAGNYYGKIIDQVNKGIGYKIFLGHGNVTTTENGLDDPDYFRVNQKFPVLVSLGCQTGNPFTPIKSLGENFIENLIGGSIAYYGSSGYGYPSDYVDWLKNYFNQIGGNASYSLPIGIAFANSLNLDSTSSFLSASLKSQMIFQGDPALSFQMNSHPLYSISIPSIHYDITSEIFSFDLLNSGKFVLDTLVVKINGITVPIVDTIIPYKSRIPLQLRIRAEELGDKIEISSDDFVTISWPTNQYRSSLELIYPYDNAILKEANPLFTIRFLESLDNEKNIEFVLDTSSSFNGGNFYSIPIIAENEVVQFSPSLKFEKNQVYYWKIRHKNSESPVFSFQISSELKSGWGQSKTPQFWTNRAEGIKIDSIEGFRGNELYNSFLIQAGIRDADNQFRSRLFKNGERIINATITPSIIVQTVNPYTGKFAEQKIFQPPYSNLFSYLKNSVPTEFWTILFTFHKSEEILIPKGADLNDFIDFLKIQGASFPEIILQNQPYIAIFQKDIQWIKESFGDPVEVLVSIPYWSDHGFLETKPIGPFLELNSIHLPQEENIKFSQLESQNKMVLKAEYFNQAFKNLYPWHLEFEPLKNHILWIEEMKSYYLLGQEIPFRIRVLSLNKWGGGQKLDLKVKIQDLDEEKVHLIKDFQGNNLPIELSSLKFHTSGIKIINFQLYDHSSGILIDEYQKKFEIINEFNPSNLEIQINQTPYQKEMGIGKSTFWSLTFDANISIIPQIHFKFLNGQTDTIFTAPSIIKTTSGFRYHWTFNHDFKNSGEMVFKVIAETLYFNPQIEGKVNVLENTYPEILYTFPNPFSTQMRFVYRFYGKNQDPDFKIYIYNLAGRQVKTITASEFGLLKNGEHLSDFVWDGKDEFGDELARGFYFYNSDFPNSKIGKIYKLK